MTNGTDMETVDSIAIIQSYFDGQMSFQETIARLRAAGLTDDEIDTLMENLAPGPDDPTVINLNALVALGDLIESNLPNLENDVEFNEPFEMELVDEDGNTYTFTIIIDNDNIEIMAYLYAGITSGMLAYRGYRTVVFLALRSGYVLSPLTRAPITTIAQFAARSNIITSWFYARAIAGRTSGGLISRLFTRLGPAAGIVGGVLGWVLVIDTSWLAFTWIAKQLEEWDEADEGWEFDDRQEMINELIMEYDFLHSRYDYSETPAQDYGLDFPISPIMLFLVPTFFAPLSDIIGDLAIPEITEDIMNQEGIFWWIAQWLNIFPELLKAELEFVEADYVFDPSSDLSKFLGDYINKQQEQFYQTIMNTLIQDPYLMLELFLGGIALKTLWTTYVPPLATAFQLENT